MEQSENPLFRKKSLDRISSPEELHDYMRVTSPRLWMLLSAIAALLVGFLIYASTATMENTVRIQVDVARYEADTDGDGKEESQTMVSCILPESMKDLIRSGMVLRVAGEEGKVFSYYTVEEELGVLFEMNRKQLNLPDGTYEGELVLEATKPISFLWN